eukprot:gene927-1442_t
MFSTNTLSLVSTSAPREVMRTTTVDLDASWSRPSGRISTAEEYVDSLRGRQLTIYLFGQLVNDIISHAMIWPSINAVAETYRLGLEDPELATAVSQLSGVRHSRFLHVTETVEDVAMQSRMQRKLGQRTGTCFQRCVGMDAINSTFSTTFDIDAKHGTDYHTKFKAFVKHMQECNYVIGGAMTDGKGDRSKGPSDQPDDDLFLRVVRRHNNGVVIRGCKTHQTGSLNSHWLVVMPGGRMTERDKDYAIACALPVDAPGITYIYGRQSCDTRSMEDSPTDIDHGNASFGGQEATIIFEDVFVPHSHVFMNGEAEFAADLVERFTAYHRRSYICKAGLGDVMIGAAATIADYNGVAKASHIKDKLVEMAYLNENISGTAMAASLQSFRTNAVDNRRRILRLIENMTMGRNAVGYLTESMHGAGSPMAQRVLIQRLMKLNDKKQMAKRLAGVKD